MNILGIELNPARICTAQNGSKWMHTLHLKKAEEGEKIPFCPTQAGEVIVKHILDTTENFKRT